MLRLTEESYRRLMGIIALVCFLALVAILAFMGTAGATECPAGVMRCKVITVTPDEEQVLLAPGGIFEIAEKGAFVTLSGPIRYWREKLEKAPQGERAKPSEPKE